MKTRIDVEEVQKLLARRREIDAIELTDIDFYFNDVKVEVPQEIVDQWDYTGLGNVYFVEIVIQDGDYLSNR